MGFIAVPRFLVEGLCGLGVLGFEVQGLGRRVFWPFGFRVQDI